MGEKLQVSATVRRWPPWTAEVSGHAADFARRVDAAAGDVTAAEEIAAVPRWGAGTTGTLLTLCSAGEIVGGVRWSGLIGWLGRRLLREGHGELDAGPRPFGAVLDVSRMWASAAVFT
ncbi:hypothetical protein, partial [Streptomyces sp. NPDC056785]|uniref:hypothetical protein n=1 Tax=Streptomyces sp. NPDC056785 TaxID=3345944 RepID=UPI0036BB12E7